MKTYGVGRGGAAILAAGAVAVGIAGCGGSGSTAVTGQNAAAGTALPATSTATTATPTAASPAPTSPSALPTSTTTTAKPPAPTTKPTAPTTKPTAAKPTSSNTGSGWLSGVPLGHNTPGHLDPRCLSGHVMCVDMSTRTLLWVVDGKVQYGVDVRFGDENNPTRRGEFSIYLKMKNCISTIYHTPMPDAMFFSGGEAVHFSIDFATYGYAHHSHGCVNVRDRATLDRLFADARVGDKVVVY